MLKSYSASPTQATIDLSLLARNLGALRARLAPSCAVIGIVKANAYGHGAVDISQALIQQGVSTLGVATVAEGIQLREAGILCDIVVLGPVVPRELADLVHHRLTPLIYDESIVVALTARLRDISPYPVHVEVDTGMGRLGLAVDRVLPLLQSAAFKGPLRLVGVMSHLADADQIDPSFTNDQIRTFAGLLDHIRQAGVTLPMAHMANTAGILRFPDSHHDAVRPGIGLYGYQSGTPIVEPPHLRPVLSWSTHIVQLRNLEPGQSVSYNRTFRAARPSQIAVLPIGYADGYSRHFSNKASVLVHGRRAPVIGRVCMDMTMIDVTDIPHAQVGDEVILIGTQEGETITADDLAGWQGTIPYEVLCAIGTRVRRAYVGG